MSVAFLANIKSRKARHDPTLLEELEKTLGDRGRFIASRSPSELPDALADIYRTAPSILFICGGDGTLRQTLTYLVSTYENRPLPRIAILRGGTMNTVATSLGIFRHPLPHLRLLLNRYDQNLPLATVPRYLLKVNRQFGFIFGLGGFSRFIEMYQEGVDPTPWYGAKLVAKTTISAVLKGPLASNLFKPFNVNLWRDGKPWFQNTPFTNIAASTIRHLGFQFKPFYGAENPEGGFGLLLFRDLPSRLLLHLHEMYRGDLMNDPSILQVPAKNVLIKTDTVMRPMLDGDLLKSAKEFTVETGPALEMVVG